MNGAFKAWLRSLLACCALLAAPARAQTPPAAAPAPERAAAAAPQAKPRLTFAVVIGNNKSLGRRRPDLHYADDDAARYFEILQTLAPDRVSLLADFDRDTQRLFPNAHVKATAPKRRAVEAVGQKLATQVRAAQAAGYETELYFVFAGHGDVAQGEGFIELLDAQFRASDLKAWLRAIPFTRAHVILDSCNSFFMLGVRKPGGRHFATSEDAARALAARLPNVGVFLSTSAEGEAFEWSEIQSGIFSHVVRSGLMGAADANADGLVSYTELAAFVDTATSAVRNPNMRPRVFARGPGAADNTPIARLQSMTSVRRLELSDGSSLRIRLRDQNGLPMLDAHTEKALPMRLALPEAWAPGALVERAQGGSPIGDVPMQMYALPELPELPGTVTLAALSSVSPRSSSRGPDETFRTLFATPFGPSAVETYLAQRSGMPTPVYGVSRQDAERMEFVLNQLSRTERGRRLNEGFGTIGAGILLGGAGIGVLHLNPNLSSGEKTEARILGGSLLGLGGIFLIGGAGSLFSQTDGEAAARDFQLVIRSGGDPAQAFAAADKRVNELARKRRGERIAEGVIGSLAIAGCATGFIWSEAAADPGDPRMGRRLGWGSGIVAGGMMLGDALLMETSAEALTRLWLDDPSLNQYRPSISLLKDGAYLSLSGSL
jgi:hypothetical protein